MSLDRRPIRVDYRDRDSLHPMGILVDLDSGKGLLRCCFFDERTGDYAMHVRDASGHLQFNATRTAVLIKEGHGNIWFEPYGPMDAAIVRRIEAQQYGEAHATQEKA